MRTFDLKPDPRVLMALTYTAMKPIDALCELVDNAIDSFSGVTNEPSGVHEINIDLPTSSELRDGTGVIRVSDNGPGMTPDAAEKALTAGYSSQNAYDRLGMFGMGLNIATGKFARKTRLITATKASTMAVVAEVDLEQLQQQGDYKVHPSEVPKSQYFKEDASGTIIELTDWWREGNPNKDFPKKLVQHGPGKIQELLGRRYATLLKPDSRPRFKVFVKGSPCEPFEHCIWDAHRYVTRGSTRHHAQIIFDEVLDTQIRCIECDTVVQGRTCQVDASHQVRSIDERVRGWVGVQRYDHQSHYGIDLIRKGRAIRIFEQNAFFTFTNDVGETIKDYPIDGIYGRIVGEVHLDHVRVDFTKQDFDRATPEWQSAIEYLRGKSSLQTRQPGADENNSPVMKIFRGYRRVRKYGLGDMYMGIRTQGDKEAKRITRSVEDDFKERFLKKEEGYYDDAKWWEEVEKASQDSDDSVEQCPNCEFQNILSVEICGGCNMLLKTKECIHCAEIIAQSASECEHCGKSQVPEGPWDCGVCGFKNSPDIDECQKCGKAKGTVNVFAFDILIANSSKDEHLSERDIEIDLPDGGKSQKFDLETRFAALRSSYLHLPAVVHVDMTERKLVIFMDKSHPLFLSLQLHPEHAVSLEAASLIRSESMNIMSGARKHEHNLIALQEKILEKYWQEQLSDNPETVKSEIYGLLEDICMKMTDSMHDIAEDVFNGMPTAEKNAMVNNMQETGTDISQMEQLKKSGRFFLHLPPETVISVFRNYTGRFFDNAVWDKPWRIPSLPEENVEVTQKRTKETYLNCLEDAIGFLQYRNPPQIVTRRARLSIQFLLKERAD